MFCKKKVYLGGLIEGSFREVIDKILNSPFPIAELTYFLIKPMLSIFQYANKFEYPSTFFSLNEFYF